MAAKAQVAQASRHTLRAGPLLVGWDGCGGPAPKPVVMCLAGIMIGKVGCSWVESVRALCYCLLADSLGKSR